MSVYDQSVPSALDSVYATFGAAAVFSPASGYDVDCTVIVNEDNNWQPGGNIQVAEPQTTINYRREDIDRKVKRGETFTVGSTVYTVVSMAHYPDSWNEHEGLAVVEE